MTAKKQEKLIENMKDAFAESEHGKQHKGKRILRMFVKKCGGDIIDISTKEEVRQCKTETL